MSAHPVIDRAHLRDMQAVLGEERSALLLRALLTELSHCPAAIAAHVAAGDVTAARSAAHRLRGVALGLGCTRVADDCARIETGTGDTAGAARDLAGSAAVTAVIVEAVAAGKNADDML